MNWMRMKEKDDATWVKAVRLLFRTLQIAEKLIAPRTGAI
jgi:hypothetical protein